MLIESFEDSLIFFGRSGLSVAYLKWLRERGNSREEVYPGLKVSLSTRRLTVNCRGLRVKEYSVVFYHWEPTGEDD